MFSFNVFRLKSGLGVMGLLDNQNKIRQLVGMSAPEDVMQHPGMISPQERTFLYNCVRSFHEPGRTIIDAGVFLGASTKAMCEALKSLGISEKSVQSFEYAIFNENTARAASRLLGREFSAGESFSGILRELLAEYETLVDFNFGDIRNFQPELNGPVSMLFLDVIKDASIAAHISQHFLPKVDEKSVIFHQDYFHPQHPWIQFIMAKHRDAFQYVGRTEFGAQRINTAVFRVKDRGSDVLGTVELDFDADRESVLRTMDQAIEFHTNALERFLVCGSRAAVQASFDRDPERAENGFLEQVGRMGVGHFVLDPRRKYLTTRIKSAIRRFADGSRAWC